MKAAASASNGKRKTGPKKTSTTKVNKAVQQKVATKAKKSALKNSGKTTRVMAHVQATNQRKQARRDSKS